jgi:hypothetical protein
MGINLCKDQTINCKYYLREDLEESSDKMTLQITEQSHIAEVLGEPEYHRKLSDDGEMKPERTSITPQTKTHLSLVKGVSSCNFQEENNLSVSSRPTIIDAWGQEAENAIKEWGDESLYGLPKTTDSIPCKLDVPDWAELPAIFSPSSKKQAKPHLLPFSKGKPTSSSTCPELFRIGSQVKWNKGKLTKATRAISREIESLRDAYSKSINKEESSESSDSKTYSEYEESEEIYFEDSCRSHVENNEQKIAVDRTSEKGIPSVKCTKNLNLGSSTISESNIVAPK